MVGSWHQRGRFRLPLAEAEAILLFVETVINLINQSPYFPASELN